MGEGIPPDEHGDDAPESKMRGMSLGTRILVGLIVGVAAGLFFGEYCAPLGVVADAFIGLLEMTVLPYIVVALIANLARLTLGRGLKLVALAGKVLLVIWAIGLVGIVVVPMALPSFDQGSFFSTSFVEEPSSIDFLELFIPTNFFFSLQANLVPGIVLFCIAVGIALITVKNKAALIAPLDATAEALLKVNGFIVRLSPYGVFAIGASTAGTMTIDGLGRLQAYLLIYIVYVGIMTFGVLPLLITTVTPFKYRQVMRSLKTPMLTAFVTGKVLVVLPFLIEATKDLFHRSDADPKIADANIEVLYPLAYPFPHLGKLAALIFIPFTAWFVGTPMDLLDYPVFLVSGLFSYFGGPVLATPFLLDLMHLPKDMMQLFFASGVITARMGDALAVMHFVALATITTAASVGLLRVRWSALFKGLAIWAGVGFACLFGIWMLVGATFEGKYSRADVLAGMNLIQEPVKSTIVGPGPNPTALPEGGDGLARVRAHGSLRVGLVPDRIPFSFQNAKGEWVGYDVELMHEIARAINVELELMPVEIDDVDRALEQDWCDIVVGGLVETLDLMETVDLTDSYLDISVAALVLDHRVAELGSFDLIASQDNVVIAVEDRRYAAGVITHRFPNARVVETTSAAFLTGEVKADLMITPAESAFPWTLRYPEYAVVNPMSTAMTAPLVMAVNPRYSRLPDFINRLVGRLNRGGTKQRLYDHWVLGKDPKKHTPRWSVIRDVLGWVD